MSNIKETLLKSGVKALKDYGYPDVDTDNIITDLIYSAFFKEMLIGTKGKRSDIDKEVDNLLKEIKENE